MKKTKLIALTMVVALMVVGAGYAAWTDQLTINQNVHTGTLDVYFEGPGSVTTTDDEYIDARIDYSTDNEGTGPVDSDKATVSITNAYPNSEYTVNLKMYNNSTMPVKVATQGSSFSIDDWFSTGVGSIKSFGVTITKLDGTTKTYNINDITTLVNVPIEKGSYIDINYTLVTPDASHVLEDRDYSASVTPNFVVYK